MLYSVNDLVLLSALWSLSLFFFLLVHPIDNISSSSPFLCIIYINLLITAETIEQRSAGTIEQRSAETIEQRAAGTIKQRSVGTIEQRSAGTIEQRSEKGTTSVMNKAITAISDDLLYGQL